MLHIDGPGIDLWVQYKDENFGDECNDWGN